MNEPSLVNDDVRALFVPCTAAGLPAESGSVRIRCRWVANYWPGAIVNEDPPDVARYDLVVFQKAYAGARVRRLIRAAAERRDRGSCLLAFDLCDPEFMSPKQERLLLEVLPAFDFGVAPTRPLADWLAQYLPACVVPDRVDLTEVDTMQAAVWRDTAAPTLVWAGYESALPMLEEMLPAIAGLGLEVRRLAVGRPVAFEDFWRQVVEHDILLNPRPERAPWHYKSDNKTVIAWALGVPVARTPDELRALVDPARRRAEIDIRRREVRRLWDVRLSVREWHREITRNGTEQVAALRRRTART
jgi:hypothetical protein